MAAFLSLLRRTCLGAAATAILSICLHAQGELADYVIYALIGSVILYLLFVVLTWVNIRSTVSNMADKFNLDLPSAGFLTVFFKAIFGDALSPVLSIFNLFAKKPKAVFNLVSTYVIILAYAALWFIAVQ